MPFGFPVSLELDGRRAIVIGETAVREGKPSGLISAGAHVVVVASGPAGALDALEPEGRAKVLRRGYEAGDLAGAFICIASSANADEREAIWQESRREGVLTNIMDDIPHCDWAAPAVIRRGDLILSIATGGKSPALARRVREELSERFGPEWAEALDILGDVRSQTNPEFPELRDRSRRWLAALDTDELASLVREGRGGEARERLLARLRAAQPDPTTETFH